MRRGKKEASVMRKFLIKGWEGRIFQKMPTVGNLLQPGAKETGDCCILLDFMINTNTSKDEPFLKKSWFRRPDLTSRMI